MPLSETALGALLIARSAYIEDANYEISDFVAVIDTHTTEGTPERAVWSAHLTALIDAVKDDMTVPEAPGSTSNPASVKCKQKKSAAAVATPPSERDLQHAQIRAQRKLDLEGAPATGNVGPARTKKAGGRKPHKLVDNLIIEEEELNSKMKPVKRIKEHAIQCTELANLFPSLYEEAVKENAERGNGTAPPPKVRTKQKQGIVPGNSLPAMDVDQPNVEAGNSSADSNIKEYFTPIKMSDALQAAIDTALFQLVICAALRFSFVENPWLINFLFIAFLAPRYYLTLSFDGWSSRAHDEIYTFHTTLPSRRSILTAGHVFKGVSVTAALFDVVEERIFAKFKAKSYSAVVGDGGPNVRAAKKLLSATYVWILNIYDPCHNLNRFLKDLGELFKAEL
ncbi:hypothetical protein B0H14DRAFT_3424289 [Mycena olivaceomarginata]|nr:hypothetical protein B0H14DRAFT_3424289 [Mycena olivaceomarginata]